MMEPPTTLAIAVSSPDSQESLNLKYPEATVLDSLPIWKGKNTADSDTPRMQSMPSHNSKKETATCKMALCS